MTPSSVAFGAPAELHTQAVALDETDIRARKARKRRRYTLKQVPVLRMFGFTVLSLIVVLHNLAADALRWADVGWLTGAFTAYCLLSWIAIRGLYDRVAFDVGSLFLVVDPFIWMGAVHATGGASSWMFFLPLIRVADQLNTTRARALVFTVVGVTAYVALLLHIAWTHDQQVVWREQVGRLFFLGGCGMYLAATAGTAERLRGHLAEAVRAARASIRQLQDQSALLQDALDRAGTASRAKSQFLANVSHEFRTPLNAIIGYTGILREEVASASDAARRDLDRIHRSAAHLAGLVSDVIELSRAEAARVTLDVQEFSVHSLADDVRTLVLPVIEGNRNVFDVQGADSIGTMVADPVKLRQILVNLLGNAGKFTDGGRVTLTYAREHTTGGDEVVFRVSDSGIGMTPEQLERIRRFEPFVQADASATRKFGGTGLGLAISHRFCALMGGSLSIESDLGAGTRATVRLPAVVETLHR